MVGYEYHGVDGEYPGYSEKFEYIWRVVAIYVLYNYYIFRDELCVLRALQQWRALRASRANCRP